MQSRGRCCTAPLQNQDPKLVDSTDMSRLRMANNGVQAWYDGKTEQPLGYKIADIRHACKCAITGKSCVCRAWESPGGAQIALFQNLILSYATRWIRF